MCEAPSWTACSPRGAIGLARVPALLALAVLAAALPVAAQEWPPVRVYHSSDPNGADPCPQCPPGCTASGAATAFLASTGTTGAALIQVDPATGAGTLVGPLNAFGPVTEIEFRSDGVLFGTTGGGESALITIDPSTGAETLVATHVYGALNGLEFVGSTLYGAYIPDARQPSELVVVDQVSGALTFIGPTGFGPIGGLAYDASTGIMYGATASVPGGGDLITIDLATGTGTLVGPTGFGHVGALEFGAGGVLFGGLAGGSPDAGGFPDAGSLITIDPSSGAGTLVGPSGYPGLTGLSAGASALDCVIKATANEQLDLWIDGGWGDGGGQICMMGPDGDTGNRLCGADIRIEITRGTGKFTHILPVIPTLVHYPGCEPNGGNGFCSLPDNTKRIRMNFRRGSGIPPEGPRKVASLLVNSTDSTEASPTTVVVNGIAAVSANLQARPLATGEVIAEGPIPAPEPGGTLMLASGLLALAGLYRLRRRP